MKRRKLAPVVDLIKFRNAREDAVRVVQQQTEREALQEKGAIILQVGVDLMDAGRITAAEHCFRAVVACDSTNACAWFNLGVARYDNGDNAGARTAYAEAVQLDPNFADAHFNLAMLLRASDDPVARRQATRHLKAYNKLTRSES